MTPRKTERRLDVLVFVAYPDCHRPMRALDIFLQQFWRTRRLREYPTTDGLGAVLVRKGDE
jgi:hypothetical protein